MKEKIARVSLVLVTFLCAIFLSLLPLPAWVNWFRPQWVILVLIYWIITTPNQISVGWPWFIGMFLDLLYGTTLGEHALAFLIVAYFTCKLQMRLRLVNLVHKSYIVFGLLILYQVIIFLVEGLMGNPPNTIFLLVT